jgi:hypothetical protein
MGTRPFIGFGYTHDDSTRSTDRRTRLPRPPDRAECCGALAHPTAQTEGNVGTMVRELLDVQPTPTPSRRRPSLSTSRVAAWHAIRGGRAQEQANHWPHQLRRRRGRGGERYERAHHVEVPSGRSPPAGRRFCEGGDVAVLESHIESSCAPQLTRPAGRMPAAVHGDVPEPHEAPFIRPGVSPRLDGRI